MACRFCALNTQLLAFAPVLHIIYGVIDLIGISLCMIVKNEERVLARCLNSALRAVDEIITVDTGSTDKTKEIAARYSDKVFDFEWCDDFSAARNFAFSKAERDYILWLDADDVLLPPDLEKLIDLKRSAEKSVNAFYMRYNTAFDELGNPTFWYYRERLIKNNAGLKWRGRVHEAIACPQPVEYCDIAVTHKSVKTEYSNRNLLIYEKQLALGEPFSPRDEFYYGRELYYNKQYEKAASVLEKFLQSGRGWLENNIEACRVCAHSKKALGDFGGALSALLGAFFYAPARAEICCDIGNLFLEQRQYDKALFWFRSALSLNENAEKGGFVNADSHGFLPAIGLCVCYDALGDYESAEKYNEIAGGYRPASSAYLHNKKYFEQKAGNR